MKSLFSVFKRGLQKTTTKVSRSVSALFLERSEWTEEMFEELEATLISSDFGVNAAINIVRYIRDRYECGVLSTNQDILKVAAEDVCEILSRNKRQIAFNPNGPTVILFVGVNGSGKTTTAGKLAYDWSKEGKKVMLAACDTFRAAAVDQLKLWGDRTGCHVVSAQSGADPSSVAFDAVKSAIARDYDILLIDTAGRQHTKKGLMDELAKMKRSIDKAMPGAPHEVWLTVDSSIGSNAITQAQEFGRVAGISGLILTKLDGTGKGGMAVAIMQECQLPVFYVGLGEQLDDLQPFDPEFYASALFDVDLKEDQIPL
jgi:fused signal recognition particle receptor